MIIYMKSYIVRPLGETLKSAHRKIVVLEGARAVGKTMLVQHELSDFHYETLADAQTYSYASSHLEEWLRSLPLPVVIDEAQRIAELPLAVKSIVDESPGTKVQFVLTGSASITRDGLSGQDPLTRRSQRYTLSAFTRRELQGSSTRSVVDLLWNEEPNAEYYSDTTRADLARYMSVGGFPLYALDNSAVSATNRRLMVRMDIDNVLGDTILPDERLDKSIAESILQELLASPGGILTLKKIADVAGVDTRTVERYVSIFVRRFLIFCLPNLKTAANRQVLTRSKVHPVDTSFTLESFAHAGKSIEKDSVLFGQAFESFVVNQIVPEIQWSSVHPDAFYWRESGRAPKEVDLVLLRDDELIGIEVKSNTTVNRQDFAGLARLREADARFKRGFVIYSGHKVVDFGNNLWAIPVSALWNTDGFVAAPITVPVANSAHVAKSSIPALGNESYGVSNMNFDANIFLSYRHDDDKYLNGGIVQLAHDIVDSYRFQFGNSLNLFIDRESINWGDEWKKTLIQNIGSASIVIPAVTPQYIQSSSCRQELLAFNSRVGEGNGVRILPLLWQSIEGISSLSPSDPVWQIAQSHQHLSAEDLQYADTTSAMYKKKVADMARELHAVIEEQNSLLEKADTLAQIAEESASAQQDGEDFSLLESAMRMEMLTPQLNAEVSEFTQAVQEIAARMNESPVPQNATAGEYLAWSKKFSKLIDPSVSEVNKRAENISGVWKDAYSIIDRYVAVIEQMPQGDVRNSQILSVSATLDPVIAAFTLDDGTQEIFASMRLLGNMARPLKPLANAFESVLNLFHNLRSMALSALDRLNRLPR